SAAQHGVADRRGAYAQASRQNARKPEMFGLTRFGPPRRITRWSGKRGGTSARASPYAPAARYRPAAAYACRSAIALRWPPVYADVLEGRFLRPRASPAASVTYSKTTNDIGTPPHVSIFGFWAALGTGLTMLVTFVVAVLTPPISGQFCQVDCIEYPYLDIADRFPRDYFWMVLACVGILLYVALMIALQARASTARRLLATCALAFAIMAAVPLVGVYYVQLVVIQPSVLAGETDGVSILTQYNPHGLFIALEELGYLLMSFSFGCVAFTLRANSGVERFVRWLFLSAPVINLLVLLRLTTTLGHARGY